MTVTATSLKGIDAMLSASLPEELAGTPRAQDLYDLLVVLVGGILSADGNLVFGGHPTVTPLVHRIARSAGTRRGQIRLFQLERFRTGAPPEAFDDAVFGDIHWCQDLETMRDRMAAASNVGIFAGGKTANYLGTKPGIRDEFEHFLHRHPRGPVYLLGALDGETVSLIADGGGSPVWGPRYLSASENRVIQTTTSVDLAASLVLSDLAAVAENGSPAESPSHS